MRISDWSSDVCSSDLISLEPSAGNGLLVAHCRDHAGLQLNEYAAPRRARLAHAFPDALVTGHDGATINSTLAAAPRPSIVLMNPPFSRSIGPGAHRHPAFRHPQPALPRSPPAARPVSVMPYVFGPPSR